MKKIVIASILVLCFSIFLIFDDYSVESKTKESPKVKKVVTKKKESFVYLTNETDNINELLKEEVKEEIKVKYVYEKKIKNGFIIENDNTYYYENDEKIIGKKIIDNDTYYFNDDGILQKNTFVDKSYYNEEGKMIIGFYTIDNNTYYFNEDGYVLGINEIDNDIYYFNEEGIMQKDILIDNCYYGEDGKLFVGFKDIDDNTYYFSKDGYLIGLQEIDGKKYCFDEEGHLIRNTFYDKYYLDEDGSIVIGSKEINGRIYNFNEDGILLNGFQVIDGKEYFLDENNEKIKGIQIIDNIKYYFDFETGELIKKDVKSVIDISSWQGNIDFKTMKESNLIDGVIVRVGYGTTISDNPVLDNKFERNIMELKKYDIPYGIYIFGYAQTEDAAVLEANFVIDNIKKYNLNMSYPIFYDAELNEFDGVKYTKTLYKRVINKFISVLNENGFDNVGVYGNVSMLSNGGLSTLQKRIPKWVAQYYTRCEYEGDYIGWQYSSDGSVPGIDTKVDMNIFY